MRATKQYRYIVFVVIVNIISSFYFTSGQGNRVVTLESVKMPILDANFVDKFQLTDQELMSIQYYISDSVLLVKTDNMETVSRDLNNKTLSTTSTTYKKEIIVPRMTPGVALYIDRYDNITEKELYRKVKWIYVDFGDGVIIQFGSSIYGFIQRIGNNDNDIPSVNVNGIEYKMRKTRHDPIVREYIYLKADLAQITLKKEQVEKKVVTGKTIQK